MTDHTHSQHVEGCFRCDLSRDEVAGGYVTDEIVEQVAVIIDSDAFLDPDVFMDEYGGYPSWSSESQRVRKRRARNQARAALSAIVQAAKAEALRELRDYLTERRRVWFGDLGVRVALDVDDPRSHLALGAYLDLRADQIEQGGQP